MQMSRRRRLGMTIALLGLGVLVSTTAAHWDPGDPHKMEYPLLPDPTGWDVCLTCQDLADDFVCAESGPITDIHFWISWREDHIGEVPDSAWNIYIFDDQAGRPGNMLWQYSWDGTIATRWYGEGEQGWVCPSPPRYTNRPDHMQFFQVNVTDIQNAFEQVEGTTYWLVIRAMIPHSWPENSIVGWKTSADFPIGSSGYGSPAMWSTDGWQTWHEIETESPWEAWHDLSFVIDGGWPEGACCYEEDDFMQCVITTELDCFNIYNGVSWMGDGTDCQDSNFNGIADTCEELFGACCFEEPIGVTQCDWLPEWRYDECEHVYAGVWMGYGTNCDDVSPPNGIADVCEEAFNTDYGDAPEDALAYPSTGVIGAFPTCIGGSGYPDYIKHNVNGLTSVCFGTRDTESNGNGGLCPSFAPYDNDECWNDGDAGLMFPESSTIQGGVVVSCSGNPVPPLGHGCMTARWGWDIDIMVDNASGGTAYVNVLFDWNQDGQWYGSSACPDGVIAREHSLVNYPIQPGFSGPLSMIDPQNPPPDFPIGPNDGYVWVRFSITERMVSSSWSGDGDFEDGETEDYLLWVLPKEPLVPKWSQPPGDPAQEFDAPSNLWFPQGGDEVIKWDDQAIVNLDLEGFPAYDGMIEGDETIMIVADDWICEGGVVTGFRWYGTVVDAGVGAYGFHLSIHANEPTPCLPSEPPLWVEDIPISDITVTPTGLFNTAGLEVFMYDYAMPKSLWFYQTEGEHYWFDVMAKSLNLYEPFVWHWAEFNESTTPILCPASAKIHPAAWYWQWIDLGGGTYADMAFEVISVEARDYEPNKVVADDWVCDGRPVNGVRWWGSYIDPAFAPEEPQFPHIIDGWFISFHHQDEEDERDCPPDFAMGDNPTVLGIYWAPAEAVEITSLDMQDCLGHQVYEYVIDLEKCCLVCMRGDPRNGSVPAARAQFNEVRGFRYWLDIQAVVGANWIDDGYGGCELELTNHLPPMEEPFDFWGWHTGPGPQAPCDVDNREACTGNLTNFNQYPPSCWDYENWVKQPYLCPSEPKPVQMAFELLTWIDEAPCPTCQGDMNGDGLVNGQDIQCFVNCLLTGPSGSCNCACADFNCTMTPDMGDIDGFVDRLLNSLPPC